MIHTSPADIRAIRDLEETARLVVGLALLRDPDAYRPWREPSITAEQRAELDAAARAERAERVAYAPGEHQDAARPDVLDLLASVLDRAVVLADHISRASWLPVLPAAPRDGDPRPYMLRAARYLPQAVIGWTNGSEIAHWAADEARALRSDVEAALALMSDGQRLKALCPWCGGTTEITPTGGEYTWRVRTLPGDLTAIVCEGGYCEPPSRDVGTWWRGRPAWPLHEWDWLARQLNAADARTEGSAA
ncbi:hypothetical protein [Actinomadura harenae]|uniref:Uncharacterized protein n=1 Tax=Actinomadura harenae TaxID=2483351 RepID=A0A3M2MDJ7_9ACTN|nr:hypothetical protein [Actinomadura harenae]RMI47591.1 hypothetical protein EBO15_01435 [Actinomadura harenae]